MQTCIFLFSIILFFSINNCVFKYIFILVSGCVGTGLWWWIGWVQICRRCLRRMVDKWRSPLCYSWVFSWWDTAECGAFSLSSELLSSVIIYIFLFLFLMFVFSCNLTLVLQLKLILFQIAVKSTLLILIQVY